jgi:hypothetical protein
LDERIKTCSPVNEEQYAIFREMWKYMFCDDMLVGDLFVNVSDCDDKDFSSGRMYTYVVPLNEGILSPSTLIDFSSSLNAMNDIYIIRMSNKYNAYLILQTGYDIFDKTRNEFYRDKKPFSNVADKIQVTYPGPGPGHGRSNQKPMTIHNKVSGLFSNELTKKLGLNQ